MSPTSTPTAARGEVTLTIAGNQVPLRFGMNVMRDLTKLTGKGPAEFAAFLGENFDEATTAIVACAVKRATNAEFTQDDAGDLLDALSPVENDALAEAITEAVSVGPLMAALLAKIAAKTPSPVPEVPSESGTNTSTSLSAS